MAMLALALLAFIGTHEQLSHPLRAPIAGRVGEPAFAALYSLVAFATFGWAVWAFRAVPPDALWAAPEWLMWLAALVMFTASVLFAGSVLGRNPALPMAGGALTGDRPPAGVFRITRHPMMWSFALWALVHAAVSASTRTILLSAAIGFLALFGAAMQDRKKARLLGPAWDAYVARTSFVPFGNGVAWPGWTATLAGLAIYLGATWAHPRLGAPVVGLWEYLA